MSIILGVRVCADYAGGEPTAGSVGAGVECKCCCVCGAGRGSARVYCARDVLNGATAALGELCMSRVRCAVATVL